MRFKYYYINLSLLQKIELYLIPIFLIVFIYINIDNYHPKSDIKNETIINQEIKKYKDKIKDLKTKHKSKKINQIQILKQYELLSNKLSVQITNISFQNNIINIEFNSKYQNGMNFLETIEKLNSIVSLSFRYENSILYVVGSLNQHRYNNIDIDSININNNIANPFIAIKDINSTDENKNTKAIFGKYVILDGRWYTVGDRYKKYKIYNIDTNYIELDYGGKISKMNIFTK